MKNCLNILFNILQFQGRARATKAKFYMLIDQGDVDTLKTDLSTFKGIEKVSRSLHILKIAMSAINPDYVTENGVEYVDGNKSNNM